MAVNTFVQDSQDANPLVRALAIRTMSRIRIESVAENLVTPLRQRLEDPQAYVRKTAAFSISKLYDAIPEIIESSGLFPGLIQLLQDDNPMVVSNAAAAICEINLARSEPIFEFTGRNVTPVLNAMKDCTEWCQTILFDALAQYVPADADDAENLIFRLVPFLRHANPAVVIGAFKCIFIFLEKDSRPPQEVFPTVLPPFLTLVTNDNIEIQYIVLRTLNLFAQKYPKALAKEIRIFFCKYNDPTYVKAEKLGIITANCGPSNAALVLDELAEYCNSVDVDFVRRSVKSIGEIAIKLDSCAAKCVDILVGLVAGKAGYAIEQAVIVLSDILRKYPGQFEGIIGNVCPNLDQVKDPQARAAGIWILGEYCELIDKVELIIDPFLDTFPDEPPIVQLQLISSIVKVYLSKPDETREQLQYVLTEATRSTMPPDIRNRALIDWRMLSLSADAAKQFIQFQKVGVEHSGPQFPDEVLHELFANMGLVSGVLHILPSQFVVQTRSGEAGGDDAGRNWRRLGKMIILLREDGSRRKYLMMKSRQKQILQII
jgi:vesicle coat complex subunit